MRRFFPLLLIPAILATWGLCLWMPACDSGDIVRDTVPFRRADMTLPPPTVYPDLAVPVAPDGGTQDDGGPGDAQASDAMPSG